MSQCVSDGTRVGFTYNGTAYYYTTNAQGDVTGITDSNCNTAVEYTYDAWGKLLNTTGSMADTIGKVNSFLYRGYYYDSETGLYYLNSRYYDANTGRFLNADGQISSDITGSNLFAYCGNNPISRIDPDGHSWWDVAIACLAVAVVCAAVAVAAPVVATATGIAVISSFAYAAASTSLVYGCVGIAAAAIATTQSIAASIPHSSSQTRSRSRGKSIATTRRRNNGDTKIYRYGGTNPGSLTPKQKDATTGLSFSTIAPPPGKPAAVTTIGALNATGIVRAVQDGPTHISVIPVGATMTDWINAGSDSIWTNAVKTVVVKWDGE